MLGPDGGPLDIDELGDRVAELLAAVHRGDAETDNLNRLVITAGLDRRQVAILRAYRKYRQRVGSRFTESYQNDVLVANSAVTAKLVRFFELRFDPGPRDRRGGRGRAARRDPRRPRRGRVARPRPDPAQPADGDRGDAAHQRLQREPRGAGVQAALGGRAGDAAAGAVRARSTSTRPRSRASTCAAAPIARGGLRWSDRQDYRTEVYGLMRAQLTKNAVIVPAGAKGGFYLKNPPASGCAQGRGRAAVRHATSARCCRVTDNLVDGEVVRPERVRVARRRRHLPGGRGRQGHGDVLRHRQPGLAGVRLLARRRVRLRRLGGL